MSNLPRNVVAVIYNDDRTKVLAVSREDNPDDFRPPGGEVRPVKT